MATIIDKTFVGVHELRRNLTRILSSIGEGESEFVVTQQGKPIALLMSVGKYLEIKEALEEFSDPEYLATLLEARKEIREGRGIPAEQVFARKGV